MTNRISKKYMTIDELKEQCKHLEAENDTILRLMGQNNSYTFKSSNLKYISKQPKWFVDLIRKSADKDYPFMGINFGCWSDHMATLKNLNTGEEFLISEPYQLDDDTIKQLISFCDKYNLEFEIGSKSYWNPGNTICIMINQKAPKLQLQEV